jgi:group I intron endonuclease
MAFIYKTINLINGKIYIGKATKNNKNYLGSGLKIVAAIKKYGRDSFRKEIIEECSKDVTCTRERHWIQFYNSTNDTVGYNISSGGDGGDHYWSTLTDEQKIEHNRKISEAKKGKPHARHTEETKKKIKESQPKDPEWFRNRAYQKMRWFTIVDHLSNQVYFTKNLKEFCRSEQLNYNNLTYNARTKKTLYESRWSCRTGILSGTWEEIIKSITYEIEVASTKIKSIVGRNSKKGENNPMFNKKHTEATKEKISKSKRKK